VGETSLNHTHADAELSAENIRVFLLSKIEDIDRTSDVISGTTVTLEITNVMNWSVT